MPPAFGPITPLLSSGAAYTGLGAAFCATAPGTIEVEASDEYNVAVHVGQPHQLWERRAGTVRRDAHRRGDVVVMAPGEYRRSWWDRESSFLAIRLEAALVNEVAAGLGVNPARADIIGAFSQRDPELEALGFALLCELAAGQPSGALFGETVAVRLAARLVRGYSSVRRSPARGSPGLAPAALARTISYVHDLLAEPIKLADLAQLTGLSTFHFAHQFRRSTGLAPHAYLVRARVEEAMRLILARRARPADAAARVGFSSQGHLTRHMQKILGVTPGRLREVRILRPPERA